MAELNMKESDLVNFKNYYIYADMIRRREPKMRIYVPEDILITNVNDHIDGIYAILKDGIDEEYIHNLLITVSWGGDKECDLFIIDYWINLFMWSMILKNGDEIKPKHIFWAPELRRIYIKNFVDDFVLTRANMVAKSNEFLNENLYYGLWNFAHIESFSEYLANTINLKDNIDMAKLIPEFNDIMHLDISNIPFDQIKNIGMDYTHKAIDYIKDSKKYLGYEHGLTNSFRANEAISDRQFKEVFTNIGTKSNGSTVYPIAIPRSFMMGGVCDPYSYYTDSNSARLAQIMSKTNVGESGDYARICGLNNTDTLLNPDRFYECNSQNFIKLEIKTKDHLSMVKNRYYRFSPRGMEYLVDDKDESLIGKTIYLRSPMTCSSHTHGHGYCKRCYGDLYYTNININPGKMAAEILTSKLTQRLLSAKHLLETLIVSIKWNKEFNDFFDVDINAIKLSDISEDYNLKKSYLIIDPNNVVLANDEENTVTIMDDDGNEMIMDTEDVIYNEYITYFYLKLSDGNMIRFESEDQDAMYLSTELNNIIRRKSVASDGQVMIPLSSLMSTNLFYIKINNDEISKTMNDIINVTNKASITETMNKDELIQSLVDLVVSGHLDIDAVHLEVILSNQIVSTDNVLKRPNWDIPNVSYRTLTLDHALTNNPSPIVSLLYQDLAKTLYNPLTYQKNAPSFFDLFFSVQPQVYMDDSLLTDEVDIDDPDKGIEMVRYVNKK